jgi:hypothetical protein
MGMRRPLFDWRANRGTLPALLGFIALLSADPAAAEKRIALVVDNSAYQNMLRNIQAIGRLYRNVDVVGTVIVYL